MLENKNAVNQQFSKHQEMTKNNNNLTACNLGRVTLIQQIQMSNSLKSEVI